MQVEGGLERDRDSEDSGNDDHDDDDEEKMRTALDDIIDNTASAGGRDYANRATGMQQ
jgi:hypothetical protein